MAISNPLSEVQQEKFDELVEEIISKDVSEAYISTQDGSESQYTASFKEISNRPATMRNVELTLLWHEDVSDWEIVDKTYGPWR
jgi:hypothetical protein